MRALNAGFDKLSAKILASILDISVSKKLLASTFVFNSHCFTVKQNKNKQNCSNNSII